LFSIKPDLVKQSVLALIAARMELSEIITDKIKDEGPISLQQFMEMCLYYPDLGYYTSSRNQIGIGKEAISDMV
jgi:hypothetical protein